MNKITSIRKSTEPYNRSSGSDSKIRVAVKFLDDVCEKGFKKEADLKRYLVTKRGLTIVEAQEAFNIHYSRLGKDLEVAGLNDSLKLFDSMSDDHDQEQSFTAERPERFVESGKAVADEVSNIFKALIPIQRSLGHEVLKEFILAEKAYCSSLECLEYYYKELTVGVANSKFAMARKEIDQIFQNIPELLKRHSEFNSELTMCGKLGQVAFFHIYNDYMNDCLFMLKTMREYTHDTKLYKFLEQTKKRSTHESDDLVDLLLLPLARVVEWKHMLEKLLEMADRTKVQSFAFISQALTTVARVATHIEKYKSGIVNKSEMNKIQLFLGRQCTIFGSDRSVICRGSLVCRTQGWASRNKLCVVFLFTDILLWASSKGKLQNVAYLKHCVVMRSDAKSNAEKKFKVTWTDQNSNTLLIECISQQQMEQWYTMVKDAIKQAKETAVESDKGTKDEAWMKATVRAQAQIERCNEMSNMMSGDFLQPNAVPMDEKSEVEIEKSWMSKTLNECYESSEFSHYWEQPQDFKKQEYEEIEKSMEDTASQDSDWQYLQKHDNRGRHVGVNPFSGRSTSRRKLSSDGLLIIDKDDYSQTPRSTSRSIISFDNSQVEPENSKSVTNSSIICHCPQNVDISVRTSYITLSDTQHNSSFTSRHQSIISSPVQSKLESPGRGSAYAISLNEFTDEKSV